MNRDELARERRKYLERRERRRREAEEAWKKAHPDPPKRIKFGHSLRVGRDSWPKTPDYLPPREWDQR